MSEKWNLMTLRETIEALRVLEKEKACVKVIRKLEDEELLLGVRTLDPSLKPGLSYFKGKHLLGLMSVKGYRTRLIEKKLCTLVECDVLVIQRETKTFIYRGTLFWHKETGRFYPA